MLKLKFYREVKIDKTNVECKQKLMLVNVS